VFWTADLIRAHTDLEPCDRVTDIVSYIYSETLDWLMVYARKNPLSQVCMAHKYATNIEITHTTMYVPSAVAFCLISNETLLQRLCQC
jgi:hypothetical protein